MMAKAKRKLSAYNRFIAKELRGKKGGTKAQRAARFKAAVAKWKRVRPTSARRAQKAGKRLRRPSAPRARAKPKSTGGRKMAGFNTQKLMKYIRLAALLAPAAGVAMSGRTTGDKITIGLRQYTGYDRNSGQFSFGELAKGWAPYLGSIAVTYGIPKLAGIIRGL